MDEFLKELKSIYYDNQSDWMFFCRKTVMSLSKKRLKTLALELFTKAWNNQDPLPHSIVEVLQDLIDFKLHHRVKVPKPNPKPPVFMKIYFHNKGIEQINLPQLMRKLKRQIPSTFHYQDIPRIIYKRSPTIARRIFNYKVTVTNLNCKSWFLSRSTQSCDCKSSKFCDPNHGHIITGDLSIVENARFRSLLTKGPKYREKERLNWDKVQSCIDTGISECAVSWARYENSDIKVLNEWTTNLKALVRKKITSILEKKKLRGFGNPICRKSLNRPDVKTDLRELHKRFILVPTDKAQNNVSIVCKNFT